MPEHSRTAAAVWSDPEFAAAWLSADPDGQNDMLALPRRIAVELVAYETPKPHLIVDVASGAGKFLAVLLEAFPDAHGIWLDASDTMLAQARSDLAGFGHRVDFLTGDMAELRAAGVPDNADIISTSRASHHLDRTELHAFYHEAASLLAPGGWLINLDHTGPEDTWDKRLRAVRQKLTGPRNPAASHHHNYPLPSIDDHLDGYRAAGITDVDIAWKAFITCLFTGRRAPE